MTSWYFANAGKRFGLLRVLLKIFNYELWLMKKS